MINISKEEVLKSIERSTAKWNKDKAFMEWRGINLDQYIGENLIRDLYDAIDNLFPENQGELMWQWYFNPTWDEENMEYRNLYPYFQRYMEELGDNQPESFPSGWYSTAYKHFKRGTHPEEFRKLIVSQRKKSGAQK